MRHVTYLDISGSFCLNANNFKKATREPLSMLLPLSVSFNRCILLSLSLSLSLSLLVFLWQFSNVVSIHLYCLASDFTLGLVVVPLVSVTDNVQFLRFFITLVSVKFSEREKSCLFWAVHVAYCLLSWNPKILVHSQPRFFAVCLLCSHCSLSSFPFFFSSCILLASSSPIFFSSIPLASPSLFFSPPPLLFSILHSHSPILLFFTVNSPHVQVIDFGDTQPQNGEDICQDVVATMTTARDNNNGLKLVMYNLVRTAIAAEQQVGTAFSFRPLLPSLKSQHPGRSLPLWLCLLLRPPPHVIFLSHLFFHLQTKAGKLPVKFLPSPWLLLKQPKEAIKEAFQFINFDHTFLLAVIKYQFLFFFILYLLVSVLLLVCSLYSPLLVTFRVSFSPPFSLVPLLFLFSRAFLIPLSFSHHVFFFRQGNLELLRFYVEELEVLKPIQATEREKMKEERVNTVDVNNWRHWSQSYYHKLNRCVCFVCVRNNIRKNKRTSQPNKQSSDVPNKQPNETTHNKELQTPTTKNSMNNTKTTQVRWMALHVPTSELAYCLLLWRQIELSRTDRLLFRSASTSSLSGTPL